MTKGTRSGVFYFTVISLSGGCGCFYIPGCQTAGVRNAALLSLFLKPFQLAELTKTSKTRSTVLND